MVFYLSGTPGSTRVGVSGGDGYGGHVYHHRQRFESDRRHSEQAVHHWEQIQYDSSLWDHSASYCATP